MSRHPLTSLSYCSSTVNWSKGGLFKVNCSGILASVLVCCFATSVYGEPSTPLLQVDFNQHDVGTYHIADLDIDWPSLKWHSLQTRADIIDSKQPKFNKVLKISYPIGSVGPTQGGAQFLQALTPSKELWLSYQVKFADGFDFRLGGKLPGLTSGGAQYTGGIIPTHGQGWSARYMWRKNGEAIIYLYHMKMPGKWGQDITLDHMHFRPGQWHTLIQHIRINEIGQANGVLEVWIDGKKRLSRADIEFRGQPQALIDSFYFSTFHGGNTPEWGPKIDSVAYFDNFVISAEPLIKE